MFVSIVEEKCVLFALCLCLDEMLPEWLRTIAKRVVHLPSRLKILSTAQPNEQSLTFLAKISMLKANT